MLAADAPVSCRRIVLAAVSHGSSRPVHSARLRNTSRRRIGDGSFAVGSSRSSYDALRWSGSGQVLNSANCRAGAAVTPLLPLGLARWSWAILVSVTIQARHFAGRKMRGCRDSARCRAIRLVVPPMSLRTVRSSSVIGEFNHPAHSFKAFRWTDGAGMVGLGTLPGDTTTAAFGVSADGLAVVGSSVHLNPSVVYEAFLWTEAGGMQGLVLRREHR